MKKNVPDTDPPRPMPVTGTPDRAEPDMLGRQIASAFRRGCSTDRPFKVTNGRAREDRDS